MFGEPKTYERRSVTLPPFLLDELARHLTERSTDPDAFVFLSPEGSVLNHKNLYGRMFKPAVRDAGLPSRMRFHDLRHTCAALCIVLGAHPKAIQERLGHSSITVTLDRYGHLFPKLDESSPPAWMTYTGRLSVATRTFQRVPIRPGTRPLVPRRDRASRGVFAESGSDRALTTRAARP